MGHDDPSLTPAAGVILIAELDRILGVVETIDAHVGPIKVRRQGLSAGQLVVSMAETMLAGGDFMCDLDHVRDDVVGAVLGAVPQPPASPTFIGLARRFDNVAIAEVETTVGVMVGRAFDLMPAPRRERLVALRPTIDLDPTDIEVYGPK